MSGLTAEAIALSLAAHGMHYAYGDDAACLCGWVPPNPWVWQMDHRNHQAEQIAALIPAEPLGFCRKTLNCRLTDGHEGTCPR